MSQPISDIVSVTITRTTQSVKQANFGTILLVDEFDPGSSPPFSGRTKEYGSLTELVSDGYSSSDYVYDAAAKIFSQNPSVDSIKVGAKFITTTPDADWTAALTAIRVADTDWYGFSIKSVTIADQEEAADWAEATTDPKVLFMARSADTDILSSVATTDIAYYISSNGYDRSACFYSSGAATNYIECAAMGERFPKNPGSGTWKFKTLTGITADDLTTSERSAALDKEANIYISRASISMTEEGTVGSGEYIDVIRGIDWLESRIQEIIFGELVNTEKIPFTDEGISTIEGLLKQALDEAVRRDVITADYTTTVPDVADVSAANKTARTLPDVEFTATLAGAIHYVTITGTVSA